MAEHFHAVVWVDHEQAKILRFNAAESTALTVHTHRSGHHLQHKANVTGSGHRAIDKEFYTRLVAALEPSGAILLTGPGTGKVEFHHYLTHEHPALAKRISAVETLDHPSDGELLAHARRFFKADDRMHGQRG